MVRAEGDVELLIGEKTEIEMTLKNGNDREALDIVYSDPVSTSFSIVEVDGCVVEETNSSFNTIKWSGDLVKGAERGCSYVIMALWKTEFESVGQLKYFNGASVFEVESEELDIDVEDYQLNVTFELAEDEIEFGDETELRINLSNVNEDSYIKIDLFETLIPVGLKIVTPPKYLGMQWRKLFWSGSVEKDDSRLFSIKLNGEDIGDYHFNLKIGYIIDGVRKDFEKTADLKVKGDVLTILSDVVDALDEGMESTLKVKVKNPSGKYQYKDIELKVSSTLPGFNENEHKLGRLDPLGEVEVIEDFIIPEAEEEKDHVMILDLVYETEYGQILKIHEEKVISSSVEEVEVAKEVAEEIEQVAEGGDEEGEQSF
ncbi:MAG: hypothetical protein QF824_04135 [Candidatus Woesearchaeota archaeon]|nr:hypothetical protein [Candidatus Woesearchaeota archaeon]